jgi:hypothetical protein
VSRLQLRACTILLLRLNVIRRAPKWLLLAPGNIRVAIRRCNRYYATLPVGVSALFLLLLLSNMSQVPPASASSTYFETILTAALTAYNKQTRKDIALHPLATQLRSCDSPSAILAVLRTQVQTFDQSQTANEKLTKWLDPTVNVLYAFSVTLSNGVGLVSGES